MASSREIKESVLHLLFPHVCIGCGRDIHGRETELCMRCIHSMPETGFELFANNPVENLFRGRLQIMAGTAQFYFSKETLMQHLMHQLKYKGNKELGVQLGRMMGLQLARSSRFNVDMLIPLPLFPAREKRRGYNQATVICEGMSDILRVPVAPNIVTRPHFTETQTRKGRIERWKNIEGKFMITDVNALKGKHVLLVDDVITTGATLESCGSEIQRLHNTTLSIACLCIATR